MNEHDEIRGLLALSAAGALDQLEQARVDSHVPACAACSAELNALRAITAGLGRLPLPQSSLGLAARTRLRVAAELTARAERRRQYLLLMLLICFGWIISVLTLLAGRFFADDLAHLFRLTFMQFTVGFIAYMLLASVASAAFAGLIGPRLQAARRIS